MTDPRDLRKNARVEVLFKVEFADPHDFLVDHAANASSGGIFIATDRPFEIGEELSFSISFPGLLSPIMCRGKVCWRRSPEESSEEKPAGIGISFIFDSEEESEKIQNLVNKLAEPTAPTDEPAPYRVLLAEDDPAMRDLFHSALRAFDNLNLGGVRKLDVMEAKSGKEAWEKIQTVTGGKDIDMIFDLAIVKLDMRIDDDQRLIKMIRRNESFTSLPLIATGANNNKARKAAYSAGADLYLGQPVMMGKFIQSLQRFLCI